MVKVADVKLGPVAQVIVIQLGQAVPTKACEILVATSDAVSRSICSIEWDVSKALVELEEAGFVEACMPGCSSSRLACCVPPLLRSYRLNRRGHTWKCDRFRDKFGIKHPYAND